jgi:serine protease Do
MYEFDNNNMMNDITETEASPMNKFTGSEGFCTDSPAPKKKKKHTALKITASLMAMALVSAGSIGIYSQVAPMFNNETSYTEVSDKDTDEDADGVIRLSSAESVSLIKTSESEGDTLSTEDVVEKLLPSVVGIESNFTYTSQSSGGYYYGYGFDYGTPSTQDATATGTGVIITENGYIVTNAHVIYDSEYGCGLADSVSVIVNDGTSYDAEVIGYDTDCDIAVLKINETGLTAAEFGDSDSLKLGQDVVAIGNPLGFELMDTVTRGIVSGLNRNVTINDKSMNLIQTDAAINSGNSGGPLINMYGQVIGINSSKMSSSYSLMGSSGASIEGIGFAIPSNQVMTIVDDLMKYGYVTGKPQLGISCQDVTETVSKMYNLPVGVYVTEVTKGSAADKAGLEVGDVITAVDDTEVSTSSELVAEKNKHSAGDKIELTFIRDGKEKTVKVTLDEVKNED